MNSFKLNRALGPLTHSTEFPYGTWDIEASNWWNLELIGVFDGENYLHFRTIGDFLDCILQRKYRNFRWFAHFGGRYDLNFVFDFIRDRSDCAISFYCSGSMVVQMKIKRNGNITKLCDSFRLLPAALGGKYVKGAFQPGLGDSFDVKHKKTSYDFKAMKYGRELIEYNEQDCRCLYECLERFYAETGVQSETFATHAMKIFRKDHLDQLIWKPKQSITDFIRPSYHGGRVEVFQSQNDNLTAYDVNSMYPYVMQFPMPVEYKGESRKLIDNDKYYGFVHADVFVPACYIPTLPVRAGKLYFPTGLLSGVWSADELQAAETRGAKIQKIHVAHYFKTEPIFQSYIMKLYELKKKASEPTRTIAKLLLNSFYGKFGQNPTKKVYTTEYDAPAGSVPVLTPDGNPTGFAYFERTSHAAYLLPHLAAAVTSRARLHLRSALSESSYYCDTDSVFTTETIETSKELGAWSEVGSGQARFIQPKLYKFKGIWKAKGLNNNPDEGESIDAFVDGQINHGKRTMSIKEALNSGQPATQHIKVEKMLREDSPKRAWEPGHANTRPWDMREIEKQRKRA